MATPVIMPQIGYDIDTGRVVEWHVREQDSVAEGDIIAVVESEKANFEVEAPASGTLLRVLYEVDDEAPVLQPIAWIGAPGEQVAGGAPSAVAPPEHSTTEATCTAELPVNAGARAGAGFGASAAMGWQPAPVASTPAAPRRKVFASPVARRMAREEKLDLSAITGTGPSGRIVARDVVAFTGIPVRQFAPLEVVAGSDTEVPFSRMRQRIADRMTQSAQTIPHFYLFTEVDMTGALAWRRAANEEHETRITVNDLIVKAAAGALRACPFMNAHVYRDRILVKQQVHIGVAVAVDDGLLVPVIPDADWKDLVEISRVSRTNRDNALRGVIDTRIQGTFTISNLGKVAVNRFLPLINPPECGILGVANVQKKVVPIDNGIGIHDMLTLTLAADHRAVDGAGAARFLGEIKNRLEAYQG